MILSLYIFFALLGVLFFLLAILFGTFMKGEDPEDKRNIGVSILCILVAGILFGMVALHSLDINQDFCENRVTQSVVSGNTTTYTNAMVCTTESNAYQEVSYFFYGLAAICAVFFLYYAMRSFD